LGVGIIPAVDPTGQVQKPAERPHVSQFDRMFPGKKPEELTEDQRYAAQKEDGLSRRVFNPDSMAFVFTNLKTGAGADREVAYSINPKHMPALGAPKRLAQPPVPSATACVSAATTRSFAVLARAPPSLRRYWIRRETRSPQSGLAAEIRRSWPTRGEGS